MKKIDSNTYACGFCGQEFTGEGCLANALGHEQEHNIIYFPITREELNSIMQFFFTREERVIKPELYERLRKYAKLR